MEMFLLLVSVHLILFIKGLIVYYAPGGGGGPRGGGVWGGFGGGLQFSKRLDFGRSILKMQENVRGVEILRHRTGLLCKSCQSIFMFLS